MKLPILILTIAICGCSTVHQRATLTTQGTNEVRTTDLTIRTVFDSKNVVGALRASNGKTQSLGAKDISQESTSAGLLEILKELNSLKSPIPK